MGPLLEGKVAIVTGGASGLGRATVELFAEEGARLVVADVNDERGAETCEAVAVLGSKAIYIHTDVTSSKDVQSAVGLAEETFGRLDIMVANAGIGGKATGKLLEDVSDEEWSEVMDVNLKGVWRCYKYAAPAIRRAGGGSMSATSSIAGMHTLGGTLSGVYSTAKAGVCQLSAFFAVELAPDLIRVNSVCPGTMATNIIENTGPKMSDEQLPAIREAMGSRPLPERAFGTAAFPTCDPREVASVHLFANSDLASFVTGQSLGADGGGFLLTFAAGWGTAREQALRQG
jgi:NAD(P)-dependent dehydrogenase (short-subunit alcohol dehydrogenase family)